LAQCQLDALEGCLDLPQLENALKSLPTTLDETYRRIFDAIPDEYKSHAVRILQFLTFSERPLSIKETVDAIAVNTEGDPYFNPDNRMPDPQEISRYCSSLVVVVPIESGDMLQLAHLSVKEYLTSNRVETTVAAEFQMVTASASIARVCLGYLLQFDHELQLDEFVINYPLAVYCARFWMSHTAMSNGKDESLRGLLEHFFCTSEVPYKVCYNIYRPDEPWRSDSGQFKDEPPGPLYYAAFGGFRRCVQLLLVNQVDVNAQGGHHSNALQAASAGGHEQIVRLLLENNAEVNAQGEQYGNALQVASAEDYK
jgi:hypothetical protein